MAKTAKPARKRTRSSPPAPRQGEAVDAKDPAVDEIDAREFERAKRDPVVKQFAERADETVKALRRDGRLR